MLFIELILWVSILFILYTYGGFFIILSIYSNVKKTTLIKNNDLLDRDVSFIISALNEEDVIENRIKNIFSLDYNKAKIQLIIVNDFSEDNTLNILNSCLENEFFDYKDQIIIINNEKRRGKTGSLNRAVKFASSDFIFFTDANTIFNQDVLKLMIPYFSDEKVGAVRGKLELIDENSSPELSKNEKSFWNLDTKMALMESDIYSSINMPGAIYILRKELYKEIPEDYIIMDDFFQSISVLENRKKIIFEKDALAYENVSKDKLGEFKRRIRIATANFNSFKFMGDILNIQKLKISSYFLWSHKIFRWFGFIPLILIFFSLYLLSNTTLFYAISFFIMMVSFILSIMAHLKAKINSNFLGKVSNGFYYFYIMNIALAIGFFKSFKKSKPYWSRVERESK